MSLLVASLKLAQQPAQETVRCYINFFLSLFDLERNHISSRYVACYAALCCLLLVTRRIKSTTHKR